MIKKRIFSGILSVVMGAGMLAGCSAFVYDYERDYRQVVAELESYTINVNYEDKSDADPANWGTKVYKYTTEPVTIYKRDLVEYVANNQSSLAQYVSDEQGLYDYALKMLVNTEIVANEANAYIAAGEIAWDAEVEVGTDADGKPVMKQTYTQSNAVNRRIYQIIDSTLLSLKNEILERRDNPTISTTGDTEYTNDTTYPIKEEETEDIDEFTKWEPDAQRYPGLVGNLETRMLDEESLRRFIALVRERVKDDFRVTEDDKKKFEADDELINNIIDTDGVSYVYPVLGSTHYVYYLSGKSIERSQKFSELQDYLTDSAKVTDEEVQKSFRDTLNDQKATYNADISAYNSAMSGSSPVLYHPQVNHFYIKHILLPFSDAQKASIENYGNRPNVTEAQVKEYRESLVDGIVCYPHKYGEDDKSRPMSVKEVMNAIKSVMKPLESNVTAADSAFDDLIYLYNTDPGAFGNSKGYLANVNKDDNSFVTEFTEGALKLRETLEPGQVLYEPIVTEFGVHILYFASVPRQGEVSINDYTTPSKTETYYDLIKDTLLTARQNEAYSTWETKTIKANYDAHSTVYEDRYKNLWDKK